MPGLAGDRLDAALLSCCMTPRPGTWHTVSGQQGQLWTGLTQHHNVQFVSNQGTSGPITGHTFDGSKAHGKQA